MTAIKKAFLNTMLIDISICNLRFDWLVTVDLRRNLMFQHPTTMRFHSWRAIECCCDHIYIIIIQYVSGCAERVIAIEGRDAPMAQFTHMR